MHSDLFFTPIDWVPGWDVEIRAGWEVCLGSGGWEQLLLFEHRPGTRIITQRYTLDDCYSLVHVKTGWLRHKTIRVLDPAKVEAKRRIVFEVVARQHGIIA